MLVKKLGEDLYGLILMGIKVDKRMRSIEQSQLRRVSFLILFNPLHRVGAPAPVGPAIPFI